MIYLAIFCLPVLIFGFIIISTIKANKEIDKAAKNYRDTVRQHREIERKKLQKERSTRLELTQKNGGWFIAPLGRPKLKPYNHESFERYYKSWIPTEEEVKKYKLEQL